VNWRPPPPKAAESPERKKPGQPGFLLGQNIPAPGLTGTLSMRFTKQVLPLIRRARHFAIPFVGLPVWSRLAS
jgi:hypothetical protein